MTHGSLNESYCLNLSDVDLQKQSKMTSETDKVKELFHSALEFDSVDERNNFLDQACSESSLLRDQVDRLLSSHDKASDFLEQCPALTIEHSSKIADADVTLPPNQPELRIAEQLPRQFGDYELLEKIAHGGMGVVFKARQTSLNRIVAIKMILSGQFAGQDEVKRFYVEAEAAGNLDHSGIVPVFDIGCDQGQHYFSMAFIEGQSLSARIKEGPLAPREAATLANKIAVAIQVAHDQGIVHRDLKPGNVLLDDRAEPRVTDFGLAKRVEGDSRLTTTGMVLGTPSYMPPEQAAGKKIDASADVYSLGAILYAMLTGRPPFEGNSQLETILQVIQDEPIALRKFDKKIPKDLEAICLKCLEKAAPDRYLSAADFASDLQRFLSGEPILAKNNFKRQFRKWTMREPVLAAHTLATLVLVIIVFFSWLFLGEEPRDTLVLWINYGILAVWALVVLVLQKVHNVLQPGSVVPYVWASINPIFLTIALMLNDPPRGSLLSLYFLPMVMSCFFRRVELVTITTVVSLIGFIVLVLQNFNEEETAAQSYLVVFGVTLAVSGALLGLLALRMKRLGEQTMS